MPRIFDNINVQLLPALKNTLAVSYRADFCVGYFNLRGWQQIDEKVNEWTGGEGYCCRLLVGMQRMPQDALQEALSLNSSEERITNQRALQLRKELAQEFRRQLTLGAPTNADEEGLRRLAQQIREGKLVVKLFLRHPLHAKLYLLFREDIATPTIGYMGSSNLTFSGLAGQGELNVDVLDQDACNKLAQWFKGKVMTQADQIRQYVIDHYIQPARLAGQSTVHVNADAIHSAMQLENRLPAVCSALDADKFFTQAKVTLVQRSGPKQSSTVEWLFALP